MGTLWSFITNQSSDLFLSSRRELGIGIVAYSPLGRGFLSTGPKITEKFSEADYRQVCLLYCSWLYFFSQYINKCIFLQYTSITNLEQGLFEACTCYPQPQFHTFYFSFFSSVTSFSLTAKYQTFPAFSSVCLPFLSFQVHFLFPLKLVRGDETRHGCHWVLCRSKKKGLVRFITLIASKSTMLVLGRQIDFTNNKWPTK